MAKIFTNSRHLAYNKGLSHRVCFAQHTPNTAQTSGRSLRSRQRVVSARAADDVADPRAVTGGSAEPATGNGIPAGSGVAAGVKGLRENIKWSTATVTRNDAVNLEGSTRVLYLSVSDSVDVLYGRKVKGVVDSTRWLDSYVVPGQFVALRYTRSDGTPVVARQLYSIASSPYQARSESAYLDSCLIEVVVTRGETEEDAELAEFAPGALVEVSQVLGRGFCSLLNTYVGLMSAMEEGRPLLVVAAGARGIAPVRALLNWTPVLAHATQHRVTCFYITKSAATAAFLPEWDAWREAGIVFSPLYTQAGCGDGGENPADTKSDPQELLDEHLFLAKGGLSGVIGGPPPNCCVLLAGLTGQQALTLSRQLSVKGIHHQQILYCDFF